MWTGSCSIRWTWGSYQLLSSLSQLECPPTPGVGEAKQVKILWSFAFVNWKTDAQSSVHLWVLIVIDFLMPPLQGWVKWFVNISLSHSEVKQPQDLWTLITQLIIPGFFCALETYSIYWAIPWEHWPPLSPWHSQWCRTSASVRFLHGKHNCLISIWKYSSGITTT